MSAAKRSGHDKASEAEGAGAPSPGVKSYRVPSQNASAEFVEKKSRFIGNIFSVETPEQAAQIIKGMQKQFWDASHNVYAYVLKNGVMRFSDDGEPSGTAGMPTLDVLQKQEVYDVLCVTTRYFGGTLLGAGGLVRAYSHAAALALEAAGISVMTPFTQYRLTCPYPLLDVVRKQYEAFEVTEEAAEYAADVELTILVPDAQKQALVHQMTEVSGGKLVLCKNCQKMYPKKIG